MKKCIGQTISTVRKSLSSNKGWVALIACALLHGSLAIHGQILRADGPLPSFEVATIKPLPPGQRLEFENRPDVMVNAGSIEQLIGLAFNLPPLTVVQIVGAPEWTAREKYVIQAKVEASMNAQLQTMSPPEALRLRELLWQSLLAERMKLKVHFETRTLPMFALVVDKGGAKLQSSEEIPAATDSVLPPPLAPGAAPSLAGVRKGFFAFLNGATFEMQAKGLTLDELAQMLQRQPDADGRLIVNQTGLNGYYDGTMKWARQMPVAALSEPGSGVDSNEAPFVTAIREQLGLRLVATKKSVEVIVVDHIERPSEN